jgi:hypothetical protein
MQSRGASRAVISLTDAQMCGRRQYLFRQIDNDENNTPFPFTGIASLPRPDRTRLRGRFHEVSCAHIGESWATRSTAAQRKQSKQSKPCNDAAMIPGRVLLAFRTVESHFLGFGDGLARHFKVLR